MAASRSSTRLLKFFQILVLFVNAVCLSLNSTGNAQIVDDTSFKLQALERPTTLSLYDELEVEGMEGYEEMEGGSERRTLYWSRMKYYISYGALSANRIPCPPRSGRSYYTPNCFKATGPIHPYSRGCSIITRCRR